MATVVFLVIVGLPQGQTDQDRKHKNITSLCSQSSCVDGHYGQEHKNNSQKRRYSRRMPVHPKIKRSTALSEKHGHIIQGRPRHPRSGTRTTLWAAQSRTAPHHTIPAQVGASVNNYWYNIIYPTTYAVVQQLIGREAGLSLKRGQKREPAQTSNNFRNRISLSSQCTGQ